MLFERLSRLEPRISGCVTLPGLEAHMSLHLENGQVIGANFGTARGHEALIEWMNVPIEGLKIFQQDRLELQFIPQASQLKAAYHEAQERLTARKSLLDKQFNSKLHSSLCFVQHSMPVSSTPYLELAEKQRHIEVVKYLESWINEENFMVAGMPKIAIIEHEIHYVCRYENWGWLIATTTLPELTHQHFLKERYEYETT